MNNESQNKEYLSSLKSIETENYVDRKFYRPIGFKLAKALKPTGITPNTVTIASIVLGVSAGICMYYNQQHLVWGVLGILLLVSANILDCVDGQLARLTGIKSKIGRILDGLAGYFWFLTIYIAIATCIYELYDNAFFYLLAVLSMVSHALQASLTDFYKTFHLYMIDPEVGKEFETPQEVRARLSSDSSGLSKILNTLYLSYTRLQFATTPHLRRLLDTIKQAEAHHQTDLDEHKLLFRKGSMVIQKLLDLLTFNGRSIPLFILLLTGHAWLYFIYEIVVLNIVLLVAHAQHELLCRFTRERLISFSTTADDDAKDNVSP